VEHLDKAFVPGSRHRPPQRFQHWADRLRPRKVLNALSPSNPHVLIGCSTMQKGLDEASVLPMPRLARHETIWRSPPSAFLTTCAARKLRSRPTQVVLGVGGRDWSGFER